MVLKTQNSNLSGLNIFAYNNNDNNDNVIFAPDRCLHWICFRPDWARDTPMSSSSLLHFCWEYPGHKTPPPRPDTWQASNKDFRPLLFSLSDCIYPPLPPHCPPAPSLSLALSLSLPSKMNPIKNTTSRQDKNFINPKGNSCSKSNPSCPSNQRKVTHFILFWRKQE